MSRTYLEWIDDKDLVKAVEWVNIRFAKRLDNPPTYSSSTRTYNMFAKGLTGRVLTRKEQAALNALSRMIPGFHRRILAACDGWQTHKRDLHLASTDQREYAHLYTNRSLNTDVRERLFRDFGTLASSSQVDNVYIVYLEEEQDLDKPYVWQGTTVEKVREMSGNIFYRLVTGRENAYEELLEVVPNLIEEIIPGFVFLSYSRANSDAMTEVRSALRESGVDVWTDENLTPGTPEWQKSIETAIHECSGFVVLLSPDSKKSQWVSNEISYAQTQRKRVFSFLIDGDESTAVPIALINNQRIDATQEHSPALAKLLVSVKEHLRDVRGQ